MSDAESWERTPREFQAFERVYHKRRDFEYRAWATERVEFRNAHHLYEDAPWTLEDLLPGGDRQKRVEEAKSEKIRSDLAVTKLNAGLGRVSNTNVENVPDWAVRRWDPKDFPHLFK
jgi:hypothetical protein